MMYSRGQRFRYVSNVFCTSNRWERVGGIPSLARAVFDRNTLFPTFHGPKQIKQYLQKFAELTDLDPEHALTNRTFNCDDSYEDSYMQIDFVNLHRTNASSSEESTVIAYVGRIRPRKGTVILSKFTENDIPNQYIKALNDGEDITLPDGTVHLAKNFLTTSFPGANFLSELEQYLLKNLL